MGRNDHRQLSFWTAPDEGFVAMAKGEKEIFISGINESESLL